MKLVLQGGKNGVEQFKYQDFVWPHDATDPDHPWETLQLGQPLQPPDTVHSLVHVLSQL